MKRRSFLKGIPIIGAILYKTPAEAFVKNEAPVKFEDLFYNTECKNENLFFLKESSFKADLIEKLSRANLLKQNPDAFDLYYYTGCYGVVLPVKESYAQVELDGFIDQCVNACAKYKYVVQRHKEHFVMLFRDQKYNHLRLEISAVFKTLK